MISSSEKEAITIHTLLYILQKMNGNGDYHKIFKILYFADQKHLAKYGSTITPDRYIAMKYGPVPSLAYDILKSIRHHGPLAEDREKFLPYFEPVSEKDVRAKATPDLDYLSESEVICLEEAVAAYGTLSFDDRTDKSHDTAWVKTPRNKEMSVIDIAEASGASEGMLTYIRESLENEKTFSE